MPDFTYTSPNHGLRRGSAGVDMLLLHTTSMISTTAALERLCDPAAEVSAHYLISEEGQLYALVPETRRAWHAGASYWAGERDINSCSLGIELANPGHEFGLRAFPEAQIAALILLAQDILSRYPIPAARVLGHADVAPSRKTDPGELFPWQRLAEAGIGRFPPVPPPPAREGVEAGALLTCLGYDPEIPLPLRLIAFQRHFRPQRLTGTADAETLALLDALTATA